MGLGQPIDLAAEDRATILALLERYLPGTEAWAYGSRVKWTSRPQSDLDLVVLAAPEQRRRVGNLREAFEESNLPFRVDLFVWDDVPVEFREGIRVEHAVIARARTCTDWREVAIGEIADVVGGGTPSTRNAKNFGGSIPWLTPRDLSGTHDRYIERGERNLSQQGLDGSSAKLLPSRAVLELPRFHGHCFIGSTKEVCRGHESGAVSVGLPGAARRAGARGSQPRVAGSGVRAPRSRRSATGSSGRIWTRGCGATG